MKLFRITVKGMLLGKRHSIYIIQRSKEEAIEYLEKNLNSSFQIVKICHLGDGISGIMFKKTNIVKVG